MVIRFKDVTAEVRLSVAKLESAVPKAFHAFFDAEVLAKAGLRRTKTQVVGPLSGFRFLPDDPDAVKFADAHKVGLEMQRVVNTEALRRSTVPWPTKYGPAFTNAAERGAVLNTDELRVVIPAKKKAAAKAKAGTTPAKKRAASTTPKASPKKRATAKPKA